MPVKTRRSRRGQKRKANALKDAANKDPNVKTDGNPSKKRKLTAKRKNQRAKRKKPIIPKRRTSNSSQKIIPVKIDSEPDLDTSATPELPDEEVSDEIIKNLKKLDSVDCSTDPDACLKDFPFPDNISKNIPIMMDIARLQEQEMQNRETLDATDSIQSQSELRPSHRKKLLDWIYRLVHDKQKKKETFYLMTRVLDRYLLRIDVPKKLFQLVGCGCLWVASKYHDVYPLQANDFTEMSEDAFTQAELLKFENKLLETLDWEFTFATPYIFIERFLLNVATHQNFKLIKEVTHFFSELLLLDLRYVGTLPSLHASISFYWAYKLIDANGWDELFEKLCGFTQDELHEHGKRIYEICFPTDGKMKCPCQKQYYRKQFVRDFFYGNRGQTIKALGRMSYDIEETPTEI